MGETLIRLDAETTGLEWWADSRPCGWAYLLPKSGRRGYLPFGHKGGGNLDEDAVKRWMRTLRGVHIDNAQIKFDGHISRVWGVDLVEQGCTFGDVQHHAALLDDHRKRFGLDLLAKEYLGEEAGKIDLNLRNKGDLHKLPAWEVAPYAVHDVELVDDLIRIMQPQIVAQQLEDVLKLEQSVIPVVLEMEKNGAFLDMDKLALWREQARAEYDALMWAVYQDTGVPMRSPDSSADLVRLFNALKIPFTAFTGGFDKAGNPKPSFTAEVLGAIKHPVIQKILRAGQLADLLSKYLDKYAMTVRADGWIRYDLHQLRYSKDEGGDRFGGTVSGRFSSSGDDFGGFNVQQVVSADKQTSRKWCEQYVVRNLFKPQGKAVWLAADAKQIEYRIFAHYADDAGILARYNAEAPYETITIEGEDYFTSGPETDYHAIVQQLLMVAKPDIKRKKTKITNFCKLFGSGPIKFALTLGTITQQQYEDLTEKYRPLEMKRRMKDEPLLAESNAVMAAYDRMVPAGKRTLDLAKSVAKDRGYVHTWLGRRARFPDGQRLHSALNRVIQGTAADINKRMLVEVYNRRVELGLTLRFTVHDELDADLMDAGLLPRIQEVFNTQFVPLKVPILWSLGLGDSWGTAKEKT